MRTCSRPHAIGRRAFLLAAILLCFAPTPSGASGVWLRGHDARGVPFDLKGLRGQVVALTFASRYTQRDARLVNGALGDQARPGQVAVVSIIDFVGIPRIFHGFARGQVARHDRPERVKLLVDEQSAFPPGLGVHPERGVDILILDEEGVLRGRYSGPAQLPAAIRMIDALSK